MDATDGKVIIFHGLSRDEAMAAMAAVQGALGTKRGVAFAMTNANTLEWKTGELVGHVLEEHALMTGAKGSAEG